MANIYLRVPSYVAEFYRCRDTENRLTEFQPVKFSPYQVETTFMNTWLMYVEEKDMNNNVCLSERMWNNILHGKSPQGGMTLLQRDPEEWPTMEEIIFLTKEKKTKKTYGFDYLCIECPKTIVVGQNYRKINNSYTLPWTAANEMVRRLRQEFVRIFVEWIRKEMTHCTLQGIKRELVMCIDHFFFHYNMCIGTNNTERDTMRRMAIRWLSDAHIITSEITDEDVLFLYQSEKDKRQPPMIDMLKELRLEVNKI